MKNNTITIKSLTATETMVIAENKITLQSKVDWGNNKSHTVFAEIADKDFSAALKGELEKIKAGLYPDGITQFTVTAVIRTDDILQVKHVKVAFEYLKATHGIVMTMYVADINGDFRLPYYGFAFPTDIGSHFGLHKKIDKAIDLLG